METLPIQRDFTWEQSIQMTRIVWSGAHDGFIEFMARFFYNHGYAALTDKYIDAEEAEKISDYLKLNPCGGRN